MTILWEFDEKQPKQAVSWDYSQPSTLSWVEVDGQSQAKVD
jgi:hypothetical protein